MKKYGVSSTGLIMPIIRKGDDLVKIVVDTVLNSIDNIEDRDVIGITESIVARAQGNYVTVDEVADEIRRISNNAPIIIANEPIYSRNRFAIILKAIARAAGQEVWVIMPERDEVGNTRQNHIFTGMNYDDYYKGIVLAEGKTCSAHYMCPPFLDSFNAKDFFTIDCRSYSTKTLGLSKEGCSLADICADKCEYGLYGSNKVDEETLKLFPSKTFSKSIVNDIQADIKKKTGKTVEVMIYGDGCFKDPVGGIWEFADPVVSPAYTDGLKGSPNEIKLKAFADDKYKDLSGETLSEAIKQEIANKDKDLKGNMASQGTTPRRYTDLLGSLMDLTSGSGDKGTPVVYVKRYFDNYAD